MALDSIAANTSSAGKKLVSVIVPVYENVNSLSDLVRRIKNAVDQVPTIDLEIILVDDGSSDGSLRLIRELAELGDAKIRPIKLSRNFGQVAAIEAGLTHAVGDASVIISADLQDPPELITTLIEHWLNGSDLVIAHRTDRQDSMFSKLFSTIAYSIARKRFKNMPAGGFDFLLLSKRAVTSYLQMNGSNRFFQGDILYLGFPSTFVPYTRLKREFGKGTWSLKGRLKYFVDIALVSSYLPIRLVSILGFLATLSSFVYAVVVVIARLNGPFPLPGWAPLMIVSLMLGGLNLLILGLIGEYIWRIYDRQLARPNFIVEEVLNE
jgi:dolichol-phosphate mannosyltransferase